MTNFQLFLLHLNKKLVYKNGSFATKVDFTTDEGSFSLAIGDLDEDGKPDLAVANDFSKTISVIRNKSTSGSINIGSFATKVDFATGDTPQLVAVGDLDGDGKPDLAVANDGSATVSVFRNTATSGSIGLGSFAAKVDFATGSDPRSVAMGDLDGDGKPDLAVANLDANTVSILRMSIRNGTWNDPNNWNINRVPLLSELVIIDQNHTVKITTTVNAKAIEYKNNAKLSFSNASAKLNIGL